MGVRITVPRIRGPDSQLRDHRAVSGSRAVRHGERRALRVRRRSPADLGARRLLSRHDHPRARPRRRGRRRVRDRAPAARHLRGDPGRPAQRDHLGRRRRVHEPQRHRRPRAWSGPRVSDVFDRGRTPGRSTITQQLARQIFPESVGSDRSWTRKIKEALVALQIEKRYTKREIFTMYCNKISWGNRAFGVEAASQLYFGKPAKDADARRGRDDRRHAASATQRHNPYANMKAATCAAQLRARSHGRRGLHHRRRGRGREGTPDRHARPAVAAASRSRRTSSRASGRSSRSATARRRSTRAAWSSRPASTRRCSAPRTARSTTDLRRLDKLRGFRKPARQHPRREAQRSTPTGIRAGRAIRSRATSCRRSCIGTEGGVIRVRVGKWSRHDRSQAATRGPAARPRSSVQSGDLIEVRVGKLDAKGAFDGDARAAAAASRAPCSRSTTTPARFSRWSAARTSSAAQFNRATQAHAAGRIALQAVRLHGRDRPRLHRGVRCSTTSPRQLRRRPGPAAVRAEELRPRVQGPDHAADGARALAQRPDDHADGRRSGRARSSSTRGMLGITTPIPAYLSVAIGAAEGTLLEMTSAYSALPNQGVRMTPLLLLEVTDREGNMLEQHRPEPHEAIRADTAYIMTELLHGVVQHGTAAIGREAQLAARRQDRHDRRLHRRVVHRLRSRHHDRRLGRLRPEEDASATRQTGTTVALPIWTEHHEDVGRAPAQPSCASRPTSSAPATS